MILNKICGKWNYSKPQSGITYILFQFDATTQCELTGYFVNKAQIFVFLDLWGIPSACTKHYHRLDTSSGCSRS